MGLLKAESITQESFNHSITSGSSQVHNCTSIIAKRMASLTRARRRISQWVEDGDLQNPN